jgi:hypothetical protein
MQSFFLTLREKRATDTNCNFKMVQNHLKIYPEFSGVNADAT